ncbi:kinase-like protein, partial [Schizopora paradoxa]
GIAEGLSYLHSKHIAHCDLKSANVFLSSSDSPLLADFGLSRFVESDETILYTHADDSLGGPRWSAPELFESSQFTVETDVWAFGMILYELLIHKLPFFRQKSSIQVMRRIILGNLPDWPTEESSAELADSSVRRTLRDLCEKCWSTIPSGRPDMQEISETLASIDDALLSSSSGDGGN